MGLRAMFEAAPSVTVRPSARRVGPPGAGRVRVAAGGYRGLEALEDRRLLADLGVAWDTDNIRLPSVLVPGDRIAPGPNGAAGAIETPILIANSGPGVATGKVTINFYLSLDQNLSGNDVLLRAYPNEDLDLPVFNGVPANLGTFSPDMRIPPTTPEGSYFFLAQIVPATAIGDFNSSNNVAATPTPIQVVHRFGSFSGRTNVPLALQDAEGTVLAFTLGGGGAGTVTQASDGFTVTTTGTGTGSSLAVTTNGGDGVYDFKAVTINGVLGTFNAPGGRLNGTFQTTAGIGTLRLGDVVGGARTITIPAGSPSPNLTFGAANDLSITSAVGIASVSAASWNNLVAGADTIAAPWLGSLGITGNAEVSLDLSGRPAPADTLGQATIGGVIKGGTWVVNGRGAGISALASTVDWSATFKLRLDSLVTQQTLRGTVTAVNFGTVSAGKDILAANILAGAWLGSDGRLGGTGGAADTYAAGKITNLNVTRNVANTTVGAGYDPVDGVQRNGNDRIVGGTASSIVNLIVGNVAGATARFLTNRYFDIVRIGGQSVDWSTSDRFQLSTSFPTPTLESAVREGDVLRVRVRYGTTNLIDRASIVDGAVRLSGPAGFVALGTRVSNAYDPASAKAAAVGEFLFMLSDLGVPPAAGTYTVSVVGSTVKDVRGNFAPAGAIGTFDV